MAAASRGRKDRAPAARREPGHVQGLARVDVAQPGHDPLIQQRRLERRLLSAAGPRQCRGIEVVRERFQSEPAQRRMCVLRVGRNQVHHAEPAWIVEDDRLSRRHVEDDVVVGRVGGGSIR